MGNLISRRQLLREVSAAGVQAVATDLAEAVEQRELRLDNVSLRDLAEALIPDGREWLDWIDHRRKGGSSVSMLEASNAVDTSAFSNITGQLIFSKIKEGYESPDFLWPELCETVSTNFLDGERIPGIGELGDVGEVIEEGMEFPYVGTNEEWLQTVPTGKRGFIVPLTREVIVADRTGILITRCSGGGRWLGVGKDKRIIDCAIGVTNNYNRNGVASNTYLTSGSYINSQTGNALDASGNEWRALEKAELLFDAITDPNTGEPIIVKPDAIVVPTALLRTAQRILGGTGVVTVDNRANAATIRTESPNPYGGKNIKVLSSPYVKARSSSATKWWWGAPKKAFLYIQVWDIETLQAASNNELEFSQDIWMRYKVSERGVAAVQEPRFMTMNDQ